MDVGGGDVAEADEGFAEGAAAGLLGVEGGDDLFAGELAHLREHAAERAAAEGVVIAAVVAAGAAVPERAPRLSPRPAPPPAEW